MASKPPEDKVTPTATIVKAVEMVLNEDDLTGIALECSTTKIHRRTQPEWGDPEAEWLMGSGFGAHFRAFVTK